MFFSTTERDVSLTQCSELYTEGIPAVSGKLKWKEYGRVARKKKTCVKVSFIPSRNFPPATLIMSWQFLTPNVYVSGACATFFQAILYTCSFWRGKDDTCHDEQKDKRQRWIHLYFLYIYIWFSILRGTIALYPHRTHQQAGGELTQEGLGGLFEQRHYEATWVLPCDLAQCGPVKSQGGCNLNIKCSACWKHNKPVYIFVPFSLF